MRKILLVLFVLSSSSGFAQLKERLTLPPDLKPTDIDNRKQLKTNNHPKNDSVFLAHLMANASLMKRAERQDAKGLRLVIVTWDGCRWQETFRGVSKVLQKRLANDAKFSRELYSRFTVKGKESRREALMPFLWGTMAKNGVIIGNKDKGNVMSVRNPYFFSYPGYSELFCGYADRKVNSNDYTFNPNINIFDSLQNDPVYKDRIAAFGNWDAFPKILNVNRNNIPVYHTYTSLSGKVSAPPVSHVDVFSTHVETISPYAEKDTIVYQHAKEYIHSAHPKVMFIGLDETDHFGHTGNYPAYVMAAHQSDLWLSDLWSSLQSDPFYKDRTILVVTCDHGRGPALFNLWKAHGQGVPASRFTWFSAMGPGIKASGELKSRKHYKHNQIAATLMQLLGKDFKGTNKKIGRPIEEIIQK